MMKKMLGILLLHVLVSVVFAVEYNPVANSEVIVSSEGVRFTVLSPRVIRMEYAEDNKFEDQATLVFVNRNLRPVPEFEKGIEDDWLIIETDSIGLEYKVGSGEFNADNLKVSFDFGDMSKSWKPGMVNEGNLRGTIRTLDGTDGDYNLYENKKYELDHGLLSRDGWTVIDDTARPVFDDSEWSWVTARDEHKHQDLYFFAYGYDYKTAMNDFIRIAGNIALPPKYAFGYWFSRWRGFTELEFRELIGDFEFYNIPLDVLVIDMDWHITSLPEFYDDKGQKGRDQAGEGYGWTGFTWNENYFSNPKEFLGWTEDKGLKTCLNLHPASGIQPHEAKYEEMAMAMGIDPSTKKYVPFDITDKKFAKNYFDIVLHPMEDDGIDFWWLDWQQWNTTKIPGVNPTFYMNYVHYTDMEREAKVRPMIYHRWGGLGNHRYQIGFSGDTKITWKTLGYQPYFTSTASNVGFGYWGNDLGGFYGEQGSDELFTRWFQFGVFSPIMKTHSTGGDVLKRRLWQYPHDTFKHLRDLVHLRYELIPYIYTAARKAYDVGICLSRPMYYDYPKDENAYKYSNQFMFGDDMMICPVTTPMADGKIYSEQAIWLPEGKWYEWSSGTLLDGGMELVRPFTITEIPVYIKAGSIIPMQHSMSSVDIEPVDPLVLTIVPGGDGCVRLYEDQGNNNEFKEGKYTCTQINTAITTIDDNIMTIVIEPVEGKFKEMLKKRSYELRLLSSLPVKSVKVNGKELKHSSEKVKGSFDYDGFELNNIIYTDSYKVNKRKTIVIDLGGVDHSLIDGKKREIKQLFEFSKYLAGKRHNWMEAQYPCNIIMSNAQLGLKIDKSPESAKSQLKQFEQDFMKIRGMLEAVSKEREMFKGYSDLFNAISE